MKQSANNTCHCWIPVLATILILFSLFDAGLSLVFGMVNAELISLQQQVEQGGTQLKVAGFLSNITGGLVNLGSTHEAQQIKDMLKGMPDLAFVSFVAWIRMWVAFAGLTMGVLFALRISWAPLGILAWAGLALVWTGVGCMSTLAFYQGLSEEASTLNILSLVGLDVIFHIAWPVYLIIRILQARRSGQFPGW